VYTLNFMYINKFVGTYCMDLSVYSELSMEQSPPECYGGGSGECIAPNYEKKSQDYSK